MRFRLYPDSEQALALLEQCAHARFVWNLALEQTNWYRPGRSPTPGFVAQCRQLTEDIARLRARETDRAKDWVEKTTTALVVGYDLIAIETLAVRAMTRSARGTVANPGTKVRQKAGLNRSILAARWGLFARRLREKCDLAGVILVECNAAHTSKRCAACGHVAVENRKSQAVFGCVACKHSAHADVNAALNILAAGRAVAAQGGAVVVAPVNCEPQRVASPAA